MWTQVSMVIQIWSNGKVGQGEIRSGQVLTHCWMVYNKYTDHIILSVGSWGCEGEEGECWPTSYNWCFHPYPAASVSVLTSEPPITSSSYSSTYQDPLYGYERTDRRNGIGQQGFWPSTEKPKSATLSGGREGMGTSIGGTAAASSIDWMQCLFV